MEELSGGEIIAQALKQWNVPSLFTLCGGHISPILVSAKAQGIQVVDVRDEQSAVFAADAMGRLTGIPGVAAVTAGPGVTNTVTALKNAQMAQSPLVLLGGATATLLRGRGALQDVPQLPLVKPVTKWATRVSTLPELTSKLKRAFELSLEGVPGPVFIEVPIDLLYPRRWVEEWYWKEAGLEKQRGPVALALRTFLKAHLYRQTHGPSLPSAPLVTDWLPRRQDAPSLEHVTELLKGAQRPLLLVGSQALAAPIRATEVATAVKELRIPTYLAGMSRGLLGRQTPLQFRHARSRALKEADLVIVAGFPFDFRLGYGRAIGAHAQIVAANLSQEELRQNRRPTRALHIHPGEFLVQLAQQRHDKRAWPEWEERLSQREHERDAEIQVMAQETSSHINPIDFLLKLEKHLADDATLVVDGGDFVATASYVLRARAPLSWLDPGVFGTLGVGGGFALGACVARRDREVWLLYGDGASAFSLAEFDTFVRHGLAPIAVVGNDGAWSQIARDQTVMLHDNVGTQLRRTDYHLVAKGYGAEGLLLDKPHEIENTLLEAKRLSQAGRPVLVNVHIHPTEFRKGSISI